MKTELSLSDFLNIKNNLDESKLNDAIDLFDKMESSPENWLYVMPEYHKAISDLCVSMSMVGIGFNDEKHQFIQVRAFVEIMSDIYSGKQQYKIKK